MLLPLAHLLLLGTALAAPSPNEQLTFGGAGGLVDTVKDVFHKGTEALKGDIGGAVVGERFFDELVTADGLFYEYIAKADLPGYGIRMKKPKLCDDTVTSYSGYLDVDSDTSLFFWAFESRSDPANDPVVLWLNGGPGCSSSTGLLFELGPCAVANEGKNTTWNKYSWTEKANVIFLDQPVQVGYSYGGKSINNSPDSARDVYAFLQLFLEKFPKWEKNDFHVAGESYAGTYIPNIGSFIHKSNLDLPTTSSRLIPLKSLLIGNGLTDAYTQFASIPDYSCAPSKYAIFDEQTCDSMRSKVPNCQRLSKYCYSNPSRFTCVPATLSCWQIASPIQNSGLNPYDTRKKCDREGEDGPLCYKQMQWIETYLNQPDIKSELGVAEKTQFESCNMRINQAFMFNGDVSHNTAALIPPLLEDGIRILIYAGEYDFMCAFNGNLAWMHALPWTKQKQFARAKEYKFISSETNTNGGMVKAYGKGAGLFTFMQVYNAGHMVPYDQPEVALDMFSRWIANKPL